MSYTGLRIGLLVCFIGLLPYLISAQSEGASSEIYSQIESRLEQPDGDTALHFILAKVRNHCGNDFDCLYHTYQNVMLKLERRFNLPLAISVADEMVNISVSNGDRNKEAYSHTNLSRYYSAMGHDAQTISHLDKALKLYKKAGNQSSVINTKIAITEQRLSYLPVEEILPDLESLLEQAIENKDSANITRLYLRLVS